MKLHFLKSIICLLLTGVFLIGQQVNTMAFADVNTSNLPSHGELTGYEYIETERVEQKTIMISQIIDNPKDEPIEATFKLDLEPFLKTNVQKASTLTEMISQVGSEPKLNSDKNNLTVTIKVTVEGQSSVLFEAGMKVVQTNGIEQEWFRGNVVDRHYVTGSWTIGSWSKSTPVVPETTL